MSSHDEAVQKFLQYMSTQAKEIPPSHWFEFTCDTMQLVNTYINKGKQGPLVSMCEVVASPQPVVASPQPPPQSVPSMVAPLLRRSPPRSYMAAPSPYAWMPSPGYGLSTTLSPLMTTPQGQAAQTLATLNTPAYNPSPAPPTPCGAQASAIGRPAPTATAVQEGGSTLDVMDDFNYELEPTDLQSSQSPL